MALPFNISTLLYCFNERDEVLLMRRVKEPNKGLWSPCGGQARYEVRRIPLRLRMPGGRTRKLGWS